MSRRLLMVVVGALSLAALGLGLMLIRADLPADVPAAGSAPTCRTDVLPDPLSPATQDTVLLVTAEAGAAVTLDGEPVMSLPDDPRGFAVGPHRVRAACPNQESAELLIELKPFSPAAIHIACAPQLSTFVLGGECDSCPTVEEARKKAAALGKRSPQFQLASAQEKIERAERLRAERVLTERWNKLTERYSRLMQVAGRDVAGPMASANQRFEELSSGFVKATNAKDPAAQDASIRTAEETLRRFVKAARLSKPDDCGFQKRLTEAF